MNPNSKPRLRAMLRAWCCLGLMLWQSPLWASSYHYAVIGDAGKWNPDAEKVRDSIVAEKVSRLILPGDNLYGLFSTIFFFNITYDSVWSHWKERGLIPEVVAIGNHHDGYAKEVRYFGMPGESYAKSVEGIIRFVVLNSDNVLTSSQQAQWLEQELKAAPEPFIFLVFHHPSYSVGKHSWQDREAFQLAIRPVIWKYRQKITALLLGHDHVASLATFNDLPVVVSGAVHEAQAIAPRDDVQDGVKVKTQWMYDGKSPYWVKLDVDKDKMESWVHFIRASDRSVSCSMRLVTGKNGILSPSCLAAPK